MAATSLSLAAGGCYYNDTGLPPPPEGIYFPTGLVVSPNRTALYIANSDFDLQYNGGTIQVLDLAALRSSLDTMLSGIRCSGGDAGECAYGGWPPGTELTDVCTSIPVSHGTGVSGDPKANCQTASDCASGFCSLGPDGVNGFCQACQSRLDCPGPGACLSGSCNLALATNQILTPAACLPLAPPFKGYATVGAFASGSVLALQPAEATGHARLFIPVRGDPSITWFDVADDRTPSATAAPTSVAPFLLDCGQTGPDLRCDDAHRIGVDPYDNFRDLTLPVQPVGLDVSADGLDLVSAHQIAGAPSIGLSTNDWAPGTVPSFQFYLNGSVANGPSEVAHLPTPGVVTASQDSVAAAEAAGMSVPPALSYQSGFVVTYNAAAEVDIFRVDPDVGADPARPFLTRSEQTPITVNATGTDSRGVVIDQSDRVTCEAACPTDPRGSYACLRACTETPLNIFIANRAPPSLLLGQVVTTVVDSAPGSESSTGSSVFDTVQIFDQVPLSVGPSKVALGQAIELDGSLKTYVFAVTFDTRSIYMYDITGQQVVEPIRTGRGPHAIAFDVCFDTIAPVPGVPVHHCGPGERPHAYLYVGHFTDSYIGVVDLDRRHQTFGTMFASVGQPLPPLESK